MVMYIERPVHFDEPVNTGNNMIIGLPLNSWESTPSIGDEIAAYGEDGTLMEVLLSKVITLL